MQGINLKKTDNYVVFTSLFDNYSTFTGICILYAYSSFSVAVLCEIGRRLF